VTEGRIGAGTVASALRRALLVIGSLGVLTADAAPKQELDQVRGRLQTLQKELRESEENREEAADRLKASERAISDANRRLRELGRQRKDLQQELKRISAQRAELGSRVAQQRDEIARMLHGRYVAGQVEPLRLVLARQDPNRVARDLHYLTYVSRARAAVVGDLRRDLAELAGLAEATRTRGEDLQSVEQAQESERRILESQKKDRQRVLASVSAELVKQRREYATLKKDEERLTRLIEKLARALARKPPPAKPARRGGEPAVANRETPVPMPDSAAFRALRGRLRLPVAGEVASRFGSPPGDDGFSRKGVFIRAKAGQDVKAVAEGRVVFADWLRGFGNLVIVDHGDGYMSLYGNNEALLRQPGDSVRAGDVIASVGASGGQETAGLYFEMRHQGRPFDPLVWAPPH
jgi:septal ring factor EnvC (AmiA/AmiB activator)